MFIEINKIRKAKRFLLKTYTESINAANDKEHIKLKNDHSLDCLNIVLKIKPFNHTCAIAALLHDIGKIYEYDKDKESLHALIGYQYLKDNFTTNPLILLPIKYHENDLDWYQKLLKDNEFKNQNWLIKKRVLEYSKIVRDVDIISNMKFLSEKELKQHNISINKQLIKYLNEGNIGKKELIHNEYDEIIYILCGLNIIYSKQSINYLKKHEIVTSLIKKLFILANNNQEMIKETEFVSNIIKEKFNL